MSIPTKEIRQKCYSARDQLWECLDKNNGKVQACKKFRALYESTCSSQWVAHFDRKREFLHYKEKLDSGYDPLNDVK